MNLVIEECVYFSPVLWRELGRATSSSASRHYWTAGGPLPRSTDSGTISWIFLGTTESSPSLRAWVLLVDWLLGLLPVGWTYGHISERQAAMYRCCGLTLSGRLSSRPFGAASWTLFGTALCPVACEAPCPCWLVEDILMEVCLKRCDCWMKGLEMVRS